MTEAIAVQEPLWEPGSHLCYHTVTQGFILGEIVRRNTGQTTGRFIRREIEEPLGIDDAIGLTPEEEGRCAEMIPSPGNILAKAQNNAESLLGRGWGRSNTFNLSKIN